MGKHDKAIIQAQRDIYLSTGAFIEKDLAKILDLANQNSIFHIELSSGLPHDENCLNIVRDNVNNFKFLIHNYFPAPENPFVLNLATTDKDNLIKSRDHCKRGIELTAELDAPFYAAHAGFAAALSVEHLGKPFRDANIIPYDTAYKIFFESVSELLEHADSFGVAFYIENNVVAPFNIRHGKNNMLLLCEPFEMIEFFTDINHPNFGYLLDVGHLNVSAKTLGFDRSDAMDSVLPYVGAFHLSDNDSFSDSNDKFDNRAWFLPWLKEYEKLPSIIEVYKIPAVEMTKCKEVVRQWS